MEVSKAIRKWDWPSKLSIKILLSLTREREREMEGGEKKYN
jgi:hypothetical protein